MQKKIFCICGSLRADSANRQLISYLEEKYSASFSFRHCNYLKEIPWFDPDQTVSPPATVTRFLEDVQSADAVLICTPEYVFSLPGILKNALEWTVSTIVFSDKPCALITASSLGEQAHESLLLIMRTLGARSSDTSILISNIRTKFKGANPTDADLAEKLAELISDLDKITG